MKKYIIILLLAGLSLVLPTSCLKQYLDKAPEEGLTDKQVFSQYENFKQFFNAVYEGRKQFAGTSWYDYNIKTASPLYFGMWDQKYTWEGMTDAAESGRPMEGHLFKAGSVSSFVNKFTYDGKRRPILESMFTDIRICNKALANIHYLEENNVNPDEVNDLKGQAHFIRAYCHFTLFRIWGPMPYLTKVIGAYDQWDIPRLSKHETLMKIAADFDSAYVYFEQAGRVRRDPIPPAPGNLTDPNQRCPNGVAAKGFKARALLYAASPLNNELGVADWQVAAAANWEALQLALANGYVLLPVANRSENFWGKDYTNEELWAWAAGDQSWNSGNYQGLVPGFFNSASTTWSGLCPTQNFVDKYETNFGEPLETQAQRDAATAATHFKEQDPYKTGTRDPRFYSDIISNQSPCTGWTSNKAQIYYTVTAGVTAYSELLPVIANLAGWTRTGYYQRKYWPNNSYNNKVSARLSDPLMRLAELYLNYAEASNEAYGPTTVGVPGATISALDAINLIRNRVLQVPVRAEFTVSKDAFRPRIRNERTIELSFEGHYYFDIRRWMDAPAAYGSVLYGIDIEKLAAGYNATTYPTGFRLTRKPLPADRQSGWKDPMYYLPFDTEDNFKMKNFVPNIVW